MPVSIANEVACKALDWLEAVFPVLLATTEQVTGDTGCDSQQIPGFYLRPQVVATAKDKAAEIQDVADGPADCVNMGAAWLVVRLQVAQVSAAPLVVRAAAAGVHSALAMLEALVDRMLPPSEDDTGLWINAVSEAKACHSRAASS